MLVTGGNGFIGRRVVLLLRERGVEVVVAGRHATADLAIDLLAADAPTILARVAASHIIHLAWTTAHGAFWADPANLDWLVASARFMRAAYDAGVQRFVGAGTCAEYAWPCTSCVEDETPLAPSTLYAVCKDAFRRIGEAYAQDRATEFAWGRLFFVYGPGEPRKKLISEAIGESRAGRLPGIRNVHRRLDFVYVDDVARGLVDLAMCNGAVGAFNLGSGILNSVGEAIDIVIRECGIARPPTRLESESRDVVGASLARARSAFGYSPQTSLAEGIALTAKML